MEHLLAVVQYHARQSETVEERSEQRSKTAHRASVLWARAVVFGCGHRRWANQQSPSRIDSNSSLFLNRADRPLREPPFTSALGSLSALHLSQRVARRRAYFREPYQRAIPRPFVQRREQRDQRRHRRRCLGANRADSLSCQGPE